MHRGTVAEIDCSVLRHNLLTIYGMTGRKPVIDVVKADAYRLDKDDNILSIFSLGVFYACFFQTKHGHFHPKHLAGAEMAVNPYGFIKKMVEI